MEARARDETDRVFAGVIWKFSLSGFTRGEDNSCDGSNGGEFMPSSLISVGFWHTRKTKWYYVIFLAQNLRWER